MRSARSRSKERASSFLACSAKPAVEETVDAAEEPEMESQESRQQAGGGQGVPGRGGQAVGRARRPVALDRLLDPQEVSRRQLVWTEPFDARVRLENDRDPSLASPDLQAEVRFLEPHGIWIESWIACGAPDAVASSGGSQGSRVGGDAPQVEQIDTVYLDGRCFNLHVGDRRRRGRGSCAESAVAPRETSSRTAAMTAKRPCLIIGLLLSATRRYSPALFCSLAKKSRKIGSRRTK